MQKIIDDIRNNSKNKKIVFVSGNFNIVHPGHLRLINFAAACGDLLVVGVHPDGKNKSLMPAKYRLEGIQAISKVDHVVLLKDGLVKSIEKLQPDIVVKGKEFENKYNEEKHVLDKYGGKLIFSSGEVRFSSLDLLRRELFEINLSSIKQPDEYLHRHGIRKDDVKNVIEKFSNLRVLVIGDLILDEYIECEPLGMSREDPTVVVTPISKEIFIGGAGIVAAHAKTLGAKVSFISVGGGDEMCDWARRSLENTSVSTYILQDESRPTTLKQRYRAAGKTLLRVSHLRQHDISKDFIKKIKDHVRKIIDEIDLIIFSDFNYGLLPQKLVRDLIKLFEGEDKLMFADSQASSQISDISRFKSMELITPTEYEARLAVDGDDHTSGLVVIADKLIKKSKAKNVIITLGAEGSLVHGFDRTKQIHVTDTLPAMNENPKDVSGAGDCYFISSALSMAVAADIWTSAYIGSAAAAIQVGRIGNVPLSHKELLEEISQ